MKLFGITGDFVEVDESNLLLLNFQSYLRIVAVSAPVKYKTKNKEQWNRECQNNTFHWEKKETLARFYRHQRRRRKSVEAPTFKKTKLNKVRR